MSIDSVSVLLDAVRKLRLLEAKQLDEASLELQFQFASPKPLAKELLRRGWLTAFQINSLFNGRGKDLVLGPYILLERLGQGGMGQVFKARNWKLNRLSALKVIRKDRLGDPDAVKRFYREVQAAAQLDHPNVVLALDADHDGDTHYFAMEYVQGTDLSRLVKERGPLTVAECVDYIRQATLGLQHAFEQGLVHRDIKPSNLLLVQKTNTIKILDLGLALVRGPTLVQPTGMLTAAGAVMGTPDYLAPEQARNSRAADTRSDIYSLGCTCYYLLTGQIPFAGTSLTEKLIRHQLDPPPTLDHVRSDVPPSLVAVMHRTCTRTAQCSSMC